MERVSELRTGITMLELDVFEMTFLAAWLLAVVLSVWVVLGNRSMKNIVVLIVAIAVPIVGTVIALVAYAFELARRSKTRRTAP